MITKPGQPWTHKNQAEKIKFELPLSIATVPTPYVVGSSEIDLYYKTPEARVKDAYPAESNYWYSEDQKDCVGWFFGGGISVKGYRLQNVTFNAYTMCLANAQQRQYLRGRFPNLGGSDSVAFIIASDTVSSVLTLTTFIAVRLYRQGPHELSFDVLDALPVNRAVRELLGGCFTMQSDAFFINYNSMDSAPPNYQGKMTIERWGITVFPDGSISLSSTVILSSDHVDPSTASSFTEAFNNLELLDAVSSRVLSFSLASFDPDLKLGLGSCDELYYYFTYTFVESATGTGADSAIGEDHVSSGTGTIDTIFVDYTHNTAYQRTFKCMLGAVDLSNNSLNMAHRPVYSKVLTGSWVGSVRWDSSTEVVFDVSTEVTKSESGSYDIQDTVCDFKVHEVNGRLGTVLYSSREITTSEAVSVNYLYHNLFIDFSNNTTMSGSLDINKTVSKLTTYKLVGTGVDVTLGTFTTTETFPASYPYTGVDFHPSQGGGVVHVPVQARAFTGGVGQDYTNTTSAVQPGDASFKLVSGKYPGDPDGLPGDPYLYIFGMNYLVDFNNYQRDWSDQTMITQLGYAEFTYRRVPGVLAENSNLYMLKTYVLTSSGGFTFLYRLYDLNQNFLLVESYDNPIADILNDSEDLVYATVTK